MTSQNHRIVFQALLAVALIAMGCAPSNSVESASLTGTSLTLSSSASILDYYGTATLTASGGTAPYTYSVENTTGTNVGTINSSSGLFTAGSVSAVVSLQAEDSVGNVATTQITVGSGSTTSTGGLTLSPASYTMNVGNSISFSATGGSGNYTFTLSGVGQMTDSTYFATAAGTATITATDEDNTSLTGTATVIVSSTSGSTGLTISPSDPSVAAGQSVVLTPSGGTPPYTFGIVSGGGTLSVTNNVQSGGTTTYTASGSTTGTVELSLEDSAGNLTDFYVTVGSSTSSSTPISASFTMEVDDYFGIMFDNTGDDPSPYTSDTPMFWIWGSGPNTNASAVGVNGSTSNYIPLINYSNAAMSAVTYRGYFTVAGPTATTTINFCIPPAATSGNSLAAFVQQSGGPTGYFKQESFNAADEYLANGQLADAFFVQVNSLNQQGSATVNFVGEFTGNTDCSDFNQQMYVEVIN